MIGRKLVGAIALALAASGAATAAPINLVTNGEFETPVITANAGAFQRFDDPLFVTGWTDDDPEVGIELWRQGYLSSPSLGSDGAPTGQHMEVIARNSGTTVSQSFLVPLFVGPDAVFRFDAWRRGIDNTGVYSVIGSISGTLIDQAAMILSGTQWALNERFLTVTPGEIVTISFVGLGLSNASPHIDQVEFIVDGVVPEPGSLLLLGGGLLGLLLARRRTTRP